MPHFKILSNILSDSCDTLMKSNIVTQFKNGGTTSQALVSFSREVESTSMTYKNM